MIKEYPTKKIQTLKSKLLHFSSFTPLPLPSKALPDIEEVRDVVAKKKQIKGEGIEKKSDLESSINNKGSKIQLQFFESLTCNFVVLWHRMKLGDHPLITSRPSMGQIVNDDSCKCLMLLKCLEILFELRFFQIILIFLQKYFLISG